MPYGDFDFGPSSYDSGQYGDESGYANLASATLPLRPPPPKRLTLEDILGQQPDAPARPAPIGSVRDLTGSDRSQAQQNSLWAGLAALGSGISGHGYAGGVGAVQDAQERAVAGANARQTASYQEAVADQAAKQEDIQKRAAAGGVLGMYNKIADSEPPDSPFLAQATAAAKAGSMSDLEKMASQEPMRQAARAQGKDPDAWDTNQRLQAELKATLEAQNISTLSGPKAAAAAAEAKATQDARLPGEKALKLAPSWQAPPQYEPLSRIAARTELVQGIEDKHAALRNAAKEGTNIPGRLGQAPDGTWGWLTPPTQASPKPGFTPVDGLPVKKGGLSYFTKDGQRYVMNDAKPELGAIPVQTFEQGDKGAPTIQQLKAAPPPPARPAPAPVAPRPVVAPAPAATFQQKLETAAAAQGFDIAGARRHKFTDAEIAAKLGVR